MQQRHDRYRAPSDAAADSEWERRLLRRRKATARRQREWYGTPSCAGVAKCGEVDVESPATQPLPQRIRNVLYAVSRDDPNGLFGALLPLEPNRLSEKSLDSLRERFGALADSWIVETRLSSSVTDTFMHPAYQQIIGLGPDVLPLILEDVESGELHWGWALQALTGHDAAAGAHTLPEARDAWIHWGRSRFDLN